MDAQTLAIIGTQLVTTLGILYLLTQRMDNLARDLRAEIAQLRAEIGDLRRGLNQRLDAHIEWHAG